MFNFERNDGRNIARAPKTLTFFQSLTTMSETDLIIYGCQYWKNDLWLFPVEWYDCIPAGLLVEFFTGKSERFEKGSTSELAAFGALPFGFYRINETRKYLVVYLYGDVIQTSYIDTNDLDLLYQICYSKVTVIDISTLDKPMRLLSNGNWSPI